MNFLMGLERNEKNESRPEFEPGTVKSHALQDIGNSTHLDQTLVVFQIRKVSGKICLYYSNFHDWVL